MSKYTVAPISVPSWIKKAVEELRPRPRLPVSQWAEANRVLPPGSPIPGPWRNSVTPYLTEIMDAFSDGDAEKIIFVKPTQVGGTAALENMLGSLICQAPAPAMVVYPTDTLVERTIESKLEPMIKSTAELAVQFLEHESTSQRLKFRGMTVYLSGANSPASLASTPICKLFLDEVDKYPGASKKEADPVNLAIERTKPYTTNRKIFMASTPTVKTGRIWREKAAADQEKHYFVPCPHCGKYIELVMAQLKWPGKEKYPDNRDRAARAVYVCQECGSVITDRDKGPLLQAGRWQTVRGVSKGARSVAYWISTLYSPFTLFSEIAMEKMLTKGDPERAQNFANNWSAEPWEQAAVKTTADLVLARRTEVPEFVLPNWTQLLTGGVDVQEGSFYWTVRAWGAEMTSQNVAHGQTLTFAEVARIMNRTYVKESGERMLVNLALVDSGDQTDMVYELCWQNSDWALPCKGVLPMRGNSFQISTVNKTGSRASGMQLVLVDGAKYKDMIAARMKRDNGPGAWMVHKDCDLDYAEQITAEEKTVTLSTDGKPLAKWMLKSSHAANHYLDCEVYAACAADILNVRSLGLDTSQESKNPSEAPSSLGTALEETWIRENEEWI